MVLHSFDQGAPIPPVTDKPQFTPKQLELIKAMALYYQEGQDQELKDIVVRCEELGA
jgi:hypothetical protein